MVKFQLPDQWLAAYESRWKIQFCRILHYSETSRVFLVQKEGKDFALKVFSEKSKESEKNSTAVLRAWCGSGAVEIFESDENVQLLEYVEGKTLAEAQLGISAEVEILCALTSQLNSKVSVHRFPSLEEYFLPLEHSKLRFSNPVWNLGLKILKDIKQSASGEKLLHGDLHHQNILQGNRGWLAIDPKGVWGDPAYDFANYFYNPIPRPANLYEKEVIQSKAYEIANRSGCAPERILSYAFLHGLLSASWSEEEEEDPKEALSIAEIIASLLKV